MKEIVRFKGPEEAKMEPNRLVQQSDTPTRPCFKLSFYLVSTRVALSPPTPPTFTRVTPTRNKPTNRKTKGKTRDTRI